MEWGREGEISILRYQRVDRKDRYHFDVEFDKDERMTIDTELVEHGHGVQDWKKITKYETTWSK